MTRFLSLFLGVVVAAVVGYAHVAYAQLLPNPSYDGRTTVARIRFTPNTLGGCAVADSPSGPGWGHDYPMSVQGLMKAATELTNVLGPVDSTVTLAADDPEFMKHPVAMLTEPGCWNPTDAEVKALRIYLLKGGFLMVDDPTLSSESEANFQLSSAHFENWMTRVLPGIRPVHITRSDPIFESFFGVDPDQVPGLSQGPPGEVYGFYQDNDPARRLMVVASYRTRLGEYWRFGTGVGNGLGDGTAAQAAYKLGLNYLIYGLSH